MSQNRDMGHTGVRGRSGRKGGIVAEPEVEVLGQPKMDPMQNEESAVKAAGGGVTLSLAGRVALVTGGSRGIGAAAVRLFREAGARVAFSYRAAAAQAEALASECGGVEVCRAVRQELATPADGDALVGAAVEAFAAH